MTPIRWDGTIVASRVNWSAKSANLRSLAEELELGLDSFVLIDDSAIECGEVGANSPAVLTLIFPQEQREIDHFIDHVWAFDRIDVTGDAKGRTEQYKQNRARAAALTEAGGLGHFLATLDLRVDVASMQPSNLARVAELVSRTNQFNLRGVRRSAVEIESLCNGGELYGLVVHVSDRFGDYGLVGAVLYRTHDAALDVDTFVLSCRVLGRGVEHRVVSELGRIAQRSGIRDVVLRYRHTARNVPARIFLERALPAYGSVSTEDPQSPCDCLFRIPSQRALDVSDDPLIESSEFDAAPAGQVSAPSSSNEWHNEAYRLSRLPDITREMVGSASEGRGSSVPFVRPRTPAETAVAAIWADLLGVQRVGCHDNFFELGGDSLYAVRAVARIGSSLGLELPLHVLFDEPTVEKVAHHLSGATDYSSAIQSQSRFAPAPLSWPQQRLWFIDEIDGGSDAYHITDALRLSGELALRPLQAALDALIERHEVLRTVFTKSGQQPVQTVLPPSRFKLDSIDLSRGTEQLHESDVAREMRAVTTAPFDLATGPLIRGKLLRLSPNDHVLALTMHHMVADGWSLGVLHRELGLLYSAYLQGQSNPLPPLPIQYADYVHWQLQRSQEPELQQQLEYWTRQLQGAPQMLELPLDRPRPEGQSHRGADAEIILGTKLTARLKEFCRSRNLTLAMALHAAWAILLGRISGQDDIVVGMPVANRRRIELEGLIGYFVNTVAVRVRTPDDPSVDDVLQQVRSTLLGAFANQDAPFEQVVEKVQPMRSLSRTPIYQVMFVLQNAPLGTPELQGIDAKRLAVPQQTAKFDLTLTLQDSEAGIFGTLNYATDLFEAQTAQRWAGWLVSLLGEMLHDPQSRISKLQLMSVTERQHVVEAFNATRREYPREKLIHQLIEEQVERTPDETALSCAGEKLTYRQLNCRANQLARLLIGRGVRPDARVALYMERGVDMIVGLLAILKAGGAYVPLDVQYPSDRLALMLQDSSPVLVLTRQSLRSSLPKEISSVLLLDADREEIERELSTDVDPSRVGLQARHMAYVIYTSGSTGIPKGVAVEHGSVVNLIHWHWRRFGVQKGDRCSCVASVAFDAAAWEMWPPLSAGAELVVAPADVSGDAGGLLAWWASQAVDYSFLPTPIAELVLSQGNGNRSLRTLLIGGDRLSIRPGSLPFDLINNYGPTECTVLATSGHVSQHDTALHIGRPIDNTRIYILDRHGAPVPIGVRGEIFIAGDGIARGYLNRPETAAQRFVSDPFSGDPGARMYRSGDLGRWRADGTIEFLGRNDDQVKIRGYRIELGEIETQLLKHAAVRETVVLARDDAGGDKRLVAYVVLHRGVQPSMGDLRTHMRTGLLEYMVPSAIVFLESLPLTANGKLDRRALPVPAGDCYATRDYQAPMGELEELLASMWRELLHVDKVGRDDSFFELGGHSLLAMQVIARLRLSFSVDIFTRSLFEYPTLRQLAARIDELRQQDLSETILPELTFDSDIEDLIAQVASMPERQVQELMRELSMGQPQ